MEFINENEFATVKLYYLDNLSQKFSESESIKKVIPKRDSETQFIEFCLPYEPKNFELQVLSDSESSKNLKIVSLLFENKNNQLFLEEEEIKFYLKDKQPNRTQGDVGIYLNDSGINNGFLFSFVPRKVMLERLKNRLNL
ncbi:hypothetical protein LRR18_01860 [Mangrovimonas sp. AS39]|nr:hypothetical protein [Mangrovimonas futianensis]MCF1190313.1 hypothetical protein [Mangrovimonas futianensis]